MFYVMLDDTKFEKDLNVENKRNMETMIRTMMRIFLRLDEWEIVLSLK